MKKIRNKWTKWALQATKRIYLQSLHLLPIRAES